MPFARITRRILPSLLNAIHRKGTYHPYLEARACSRWSVHNRNKHVCGGSYVGYVPTYGGFGDTWRSHLNFPGESYVSAVSHSHSFSSSLSHSPSFSQRLSVRLCLTLSLPLSPSTSLFIPRSPTLLGRARALIWPTCIPHSWHPAVILARSPHSRRVHVELSRLRSAETALMDFEILLRLSCVHEIT